MMKTKNKISVLALGCVASLALGGVALNTAPAKADVDNDKFEMYYGAQVALQKDGMRWVVQMGQNVYDEIVTNDADEKVALTVFVSSVEYFNAVEDGDYSQLGKKVQIDIPEDMIYTNTGYYYANAVLTNLEAVSQFDNELVAVAAIATTGDEGVAYEYADFANGDMANNVRTQYGILQSAALDTEEDADYAAELILKNDETSPYDGWFGTETYPIVANDADKVDALKTQINKGFEVNAWVEYHTYVGGTVELDEDKALPTNITKYHKVSFYTDPSDAAVPVEEIVKDGEAATAPATSEISKYAAVEGMNGYVRGYRRTSDGWVVKGTETSVDDFSAITETQAYLYGAWEYTQLQTYLQADLAVEAPNTVFAYSSELGVSHTDTASTVCTRSFDTSVKLEGQRGSTRLQFANLGKTDLYVYWKPNTAPATVCTWNYDFTGHENDYISMDVYVDFEDPVTAVWLNFGYVATGTAIPNKTWAKVVVPVSSITGASGWYFIRLRGGAAAGSIYLTDATILTADEVVDLSDSADTVVDTYTVGNTTFAGAVTQFAYNGYSTKGTHKRTPNDGVFGGKLNFETFLVDGQLFYYHDAGVHGAVELTFADVVTGKLYVTARGLSDDAQLQLFNANVTEVGFVGGEDGSYITGGVKSAEIVDEGDGYKTYCFDLGSYEVKAIRLYTGYAETDAAEAYYRQIVVRDFTVVATEA